MSEEWLARMEQEQTLYNHGMVRLMPDGWLYPTLFTKYANTIYNFKFSESDTVVMGMCRSGTTWVLEILWTMRHNPDLNNQQGHQPIIIRAPHIDFDMMIDSKTIKSTVDKPEQFTEVFRQMCPSKKSEDGIFLQMSEALPAPRVIKTHLPLSLLPPHLLHTTKVVYIARNPKDVVVSLFHHFCNTKFHDYTGTFDNFVKHYMNDDLLYSPYWPNLMMAWKKKDHPNMHFIFYEDLKADLKKQLGILNEFLGTNLSQQQLDNVAQHTSFSSMKARCIKHAENYHKGAHKSAGDFFRKARKMNKKLDSGHEVVAMSEEWLARMEQEQTLYNHGMVRLMPDGWLYPTLFTKYANTIYNFKFSESDTVVMGMCRSGTTWVLEILWTMRHNPDLNNQQGHLPIIIRAPHIDFDMMIDSKTIKSTVDKPEQFTEVFRQMCPGKKSEDGIFLQMSEALPAPRVIKTHLPLSLLPPHLLHTTKVVYIARNLKDVVVSLFHHFCNTKFHDYTGTFDNFVKHYMNDDLLYSPYWPNLMMAWKKKDHPNMHFIFYEDLKADLKKELGILNEFLGTNLSQQQLDNVAQHTSFSSMKARCIEHAENYHKGAHKSAGDFFRKGETGDWKNHFSPELEQQMNHWIEDNSEDITFK